VKSLAYGSSVPHIDVSDVLSYEVVRLGPKEESAISELAEASAQARSAADVLERELATDTATIIDRFLAG
jgi:hypothetical protein